MNITISDKANALLQLDIELQRLNSEWGRINAQLESVKVRQMVISKAMRQIVASATYDLGDMN